MKLNNINKVKKINLDSIKSKEAIIDVFEEINKYFVIKRIFTITNNDLKNNLRGKHAHKIDQQIITCPYGSIRFTVKDGKRKKSFLLNNTNVAIYVPQHIWTETKYLIKNTVVVCYSSSKFNEKSYIRNYNEFLKFRKII